MRNLCVSVRLCSFLMLSAMILTMPSPLFAASDGDQVTRPLLLPDLQPLKNPADQQAVQGGTLSEDDAATLVEHTICPDCKNDTGAYVLIHIIRWIPKDTSFEARSSNWYIYRASRGTLSRWSREDFATRNRLYGAKRMYLLSVQVADDKVEPNPGKYVYTESKRVPTNIQDLLALFEMVTQKKGFRTPPTLTGTVWSGTKISRTFTTANISIASSFTTPDSKASELTMPTYSLIDEQKAWWDVSIAVPISKISEVQYSSVNNTVTPTTVNRQNVFAVVDLYLPKKDLALTQYSLIPHPLFGVSMASKPLNSLLVGGAVGFSFGEVYVGANLLKQENLSGLSAGSAATPQQLSAATDRSFHARFNVGINLSVRAAVAAIKGAAK